VCKKNSITSIMHLAVKQCMTFNVIKAIKITTKNETKYAALMFKRAKRLHIRIVIGVSLP